MIKDIFENLELANLNPFFIGQHKGICKEPFIVVREGMQIPSLGSNRVGQRIIDIIIFVPLNSYIELDPYMKEVKLVLKELTDLRKTGNETPAVVDDDKQAYTTNIEYVIQKTLEE